MKWITHQTGAVAASLALGLPAIATAAAWAGSTLPDALDQGAAKLGRSKKQRQKIFNQVHRGSSHWFGWWLALFVAGMAANLPPLALAVCQGLAFGALSHVFMDMLTTRGVPLLPFTTRGRVSLGLCSTGKAGEYVFLCAIVAASAWFMGPQILETLGRFAV